MQITSTRRPHGSVAAVAVLVVAVMLLAACGGDGDEVAGEADSDQNGGSQGGDAGEPVVGGQLVYGLTEDANGFNPISDPWSSVTYSMVGSILEPLAAVDEDGIAQPYLAESIEPNEDATVWTVVLREGIEFSNGEPLTAEVVQANLQAHMESPLNATVLTRLESVEVVDDRTIVANLTEPWVSFPFYLTGQIGRPIPMTMLDNPEQASLEPIGTGAFVYDDYAPDSRFVMVRNPGYWRDGLPYLDGVEFRILADAQTRQQTLEAGGIDAMTTSESADIVRYQDDPGYNLYRPAGMSQSELTFNLNTQVAPLDDVDVRRAIAHATDRQLFIDVLAEGLNEPADGPWTEDSPWYCAAGDYPEYDLEQATALVDEYEAENGPIRITLMSVPTESSLELAQLAQDSWGQAGIEVEIVQADLSNLIDRALNGDYNAVIWQEYASIEPDGEFFKFHSDFAKPVGELAINPTRISDPEIDAGFETGRTSLDIAEREEAYCMVQERLRELVPVVFISHVSTSAVVAESTVHDIAGFELPDGQKALPPSGSPVPSHPFTQIWVEG